MYTYHQVQVNTFGSDNHCEYFVSQTSSGCLWLQACRRLHSGEFIYISNTNVLSKCHYETFIPTIQAVTKYCEAWECMTGREPATSNGRHLAVRLVFASYLTRKDGSYTTFGSHHSSLKNFRKTYSCCTSGGSRMQTPALTRTRASNSSLNTRCQMSLAGILPRAPVFHYISSSLVHGSRQGWVQTIIPMVVEPTL